MKKITKEEIEKTNDKYELGKCGKCGGKYVWRTFSVDDGLGCIDFETEEWCEDCGSESGGYELIETNTEYDKVKDEENKLESKII